jgi:hypothetical protein
LTGLRRAAGRAARKTEKRRQNQAERRSKSYGNSSSHSFPYSALHLSDQVTEEEISPQKAHKAQKKPTVLPFAPYFDQRRAFEFRLFTIVVFGANAAPRQFAQVSGSQFDRALNLTADAQ